MNDGGASTQGRDYWLFFAAEARRAGAPLYERLSLAIAGDEEVQAFAAGVRAGQPAPNILFAAVHFLLLRGADHPVCGFYRDLGGTADGDPFPAFRDFVLLHREALAPLIGGRVTNTNEVGRSALLAPAFRAVAAAAGEPLHLVEIGPSAGLNLVWDSYGVRYHRGEEVLPLGPAEPALVLDCALHGDGLPPFGPAPHIASRIGLERHPVDLADAVERDWLKALVWPDRPDRLDRLDKALAILAQQRPAIRRGDALEMLPEAVAEVPPNEAVCIYHTMVTYQFSDDAREAFEAILTLMGLRRPVWRLSFEGTRQGENRLSLTAYRNGTTSHRLLARGHAHGDWLEWLDSACDFPQP